MAPWCEACKLFTPELEKVNSYYFFSQFYIFIIILIGSKDTLNP